MTDGTSIDTAEIQAIDAAINWALRYNDRQVNEHKKGIVIYSDSLRGIKAIQKELNVKIAPHNQTDISVVWIPGP